MKTTQLVCAIFSALSLSLLTLPSHAQTTDVEEHRIMVRETETAPAQAIEVRRLGVAGQPANIAAFSTAATAPGMMFVSSGNLMGGLFPPELIMANQDRLDLSTQQTESIKNEMRTFQSDIVDIQWELNAAQSALNGLMEEDRIDEDQSIAAVERMMNAENALKKSHLRLLIRIRNLLNEDQLEELQNGPMPFGGFAMPMPTPYSYMRWNSAP